MIMGVDDSYVPEDPDTSPVPPLPEDAMERRGAAFCLRHLIYQQGGLWTAQRACEALASVGWQTRAKYPQNVAGNILFRLCEYGALRQRSWGVYSVNPRILEEILISGIRSRERDRRKRSQARGPENHGEANARPS